MKKPAVVWDVDDVLTPTSEAFYQAALRTHGICPHPDSWDDYLWGKHIGRPEGRETQEYLIEHEIIEHTKPYDYTQEALTLTKEHGLANILLSARAWHPDPHAVTKQWGVNHGLHTCISEMHFLELDECKSDVLQRLKEQFDIKAFVEDNARNAVTAIGVVPQVYLVQRPWNFNHANRHGLWHVHTALEAAKMIVA